MTHALIALVGVVGGYVLLCVVCALIRSGQCGADQEDWIKEGEGELR